MYRVLTSIAFCVLSIACILFEAFNAALLTSLLSFFILLYHTMRAVGVNSVLFLFMILFGLYGYSVPVSVFFEADIGWHRVAKLSTWEKVDDTLFSFLLSNQLALLAITLLYFFFVNKRIMREGNQGDDPSKIIYYRIAIVAGILSSLSEGLNFVRAGGFSTMFKGKAFYQGAVNDLALNIPYEGFFYIAVALFGQFFASTKSKVKYITYLPYFLGSISFVLFVNIAIGERGTLLVAMVVFTLAYTIKQRIRSIKPKYIVLLAILYALFNVFTLLREKSIVYEGLGSFLKDNKEKLYKLMNPANTEFGSPALNYRIFFDRKPKDYEFKWGKTYTEISVAFIPTYIYPGKPKGIVFEFRDRYFAERKELGSTAGTGFSSLMEAYMNFSYFGPFLIYSISIFLLIYVESKKGRNNMFINLFYLLLFNIFLII